MLLFMSLTRSEEAGEKAVYARQCRTPVRHHNFQSLKKSAFKHKNFELCRELEVALTNTTLQSVYRTFYESDLREGLRFSKTSHQPDSAKLLHLDPTS